MATKFIPVLITFIVLIHNSNAFFTNLHLATRRRPATSQLGGAPVGYPQRDVSRLIGQNPNLYRSLFPADEVVETETRFNAESFEDLCESTITSEMPTELTRYSDNKPMVIAQDFKNNIKQRIKFVKCKTSGKCKYDAFPSTFESVCHQEFAQRKLFVFEDGAITTDIFLTPACCTCRLKRIDAE